MRLAIAERLLGSFSSEGQVRSMLRRPAKPLLDNDSIATVLEADNPFGLGYSSRLTDRRTKRLVGFNYCQCSSQHNNSSFAYTSHAIICYILPNTRYLQS